MTKLLLLLIGFLINFDFTTQAAASEKESGVAKTTISKELNPYLLGPLANIVKEYFNDKIILRFEARNEKEKKDFETGFKKYQQPLFYWGKMKDSNENIPFIPESFNIKVNEDINVFPLEIGAKFPMKFCHRNQAGNVSIKTDEIIVKNENRYNFLISSIMWQTHAGPLIFPTNPGYKYIIRYAPCNKDERNYTSFSNYCVQEEKIMID